MERQQTDNLLRSHASGTYLIRERPAEAERFAISIKYVLALGAEGTHPHCRSEPQNPHPLPVWGLWGWGGLGRCCPNLDTLEVRLSLGLYTQLALSLRE